MLLSGLILVFGMMFRSETADAQARYNGRAVSTAGRTASYRQSHAAGSLRNTRTVQAKTSELSSRPNQSSRPERIGGPYRSVLTSRAAPEAPTLPHTARAVKSQSYKSEYVPRSEVKQ